MTRGRGQPLPPPPLPKPQCWGDRVLPKGRTGGIAVGSKTNWLGRLPPPSGSREARGRDSLDPKQVAPGHKGASGPAARQHPGQDRRAAPRLPPMLPLNHQGPEPSPSPPSPPMHLRGSPAQVLAGRVEFRLRRQDGSEPLHRCSLNEARVSWSTRTSFGPQMLPHTAQVSPLCASALEVTPNPLWSTLPKGGPCQGASSALGSCHPT